MKKILGFIAAGCLLLTSCDDKLDIKPLGKTTLDNVTDIETLLNQRWLVSEPSDLLTVCDATYKRMTQLSTTMSNKNEIDYALINYDETINRADLTPTDSKYTSMYQYINYANVVISKTPGVSGDESQKPRIIAEAKILRAWFHFLLVNIYARQYDEATAAHLGGIPYVDNTNVQEQKTKLTISEVYNHILQDCSDEVISCLTQHNVSDPCRFGADFGYGVRARVLFQMKRYEEALKYANLAMKINSEIEDRSSVASSGVWELWESSPNNYLHIASDNSNIGEFGMIIVPPSTFAKYEDGDYVKDFVAPPYNWMSEYGTMYGYEGCMFSYIWDVHFNSWGLRTEQMCYIAAESMIRNGQYRDGLAMIDRVRINRIHPDYYTPLADNADSAMTEGEAMRMLRDAKLIEMIPSFEPFFDAKRWNSEQEYAADYTRDLGPDYGKRTITPDSPLWVFPFPANATNYNSSLTQNY